MVVDLLLLAAEDQLTHELARQEVVGEAAADLDLGVSDTRNPLRPSSL